MAVATVARPTLPVSAVSLGRIGRAHTLRAEVDLRSAIDLEERQMGFGKKFGPGEGFSVRPGGEMASDEDDVEGHMTSGDSAGRESGESDKQARSGRIDMNDKRQDDDQDTEGHSFRVSGGHPIPKESDDDTEGHGLRPSGGGNRPLVRASDDDTEGHGLRPSGGGNRPLVRASDDDTEGHGLRPSGGGNRPLVRESDDGDDTEGHRMNVSGNVPQKK